MVCQTSLCDMFNTDINKYDNSTYLIESFHSLWIGS